MSASRRLFILVPAIAILALTTWTLMGEKSLHVFAEAIGDPCCTAPTPEATKAKSAIPIACKISDPVVQKARMAEMKELFQSAIEVQNNPGELRMKYDSKLTSQLLEYIKFERECCPFFSFKLEFEAGLDPVWLTISGPDSMLQTLSAQAKK